MAIEPPEGVRDLFLVLTGEQYPSANPDHMREVAQVLGWISEELGNELAPLLVQAVNTIRADFSGEAARQFAEMMAPYVTDEPRYLPATAEQFLRLREFLEKAAVDTEYAQIITIGELVLLLAQIAWAMAAASWSFGSSLAWLAARIVVVRFLLQTLWGRLVLQFALAELMGIAFQVVLDVVTQLVQFAKGTRHEWNLRATGSAVVVGAIGGALAVPFSMLGHYVTKNFTNRILRMLGDPGKGVTGFAVSDVVESAIHQYGRHVDDWGSKVAEETFRRMSTNRQFAAAFARSGIPFTVEVFEEALHEAFTEALAGLALGNGFQWNWFAMTSGAFSSIATQSGFSLGHKLAGPANNGGVSPKDSPTGSPQNVVFYGKSTSPSTPSSTPPSTPFNTAPSTPSTTPFNTPPSTPSTTPLDAPLSGAGLPSGGAVPVGGVVQPPSRSTAP
ncbi:hypothetical protein, partial [Actinoallomurus sp. NPDC050550]|uniref:WXG100 family type VII secretion target n=1 Tax=Actinoallomurus sp. NPDC050550 TaxID=3154937 RepID=UPI0033EBB94D